MWALQPLPVSAWGLLLKDVVFWVLHKLASNSLNLPKPSYSQHGGEETWECVGA